MPASKSKLSEGDWFLVPLTTSGHVVGRVARRTRGGVVLGYFFGPRATEWPSDDELAVLRPANAIWVRRFGDLGIVEGVWPTKPSRNWVKSEWPIPKFIRRSGRYAEIVTYGDDLRVIDVRSCSAEVARRHPPDVLSGFRAAEVVLTHIVDGTETPHIKSELVATKRFLKSLR